ncbi:hypothetical protein L6164_015631 [Bauhinia variegata]|uniref:Uncharacterized protein n=1 Tax=Bauhinia variegata TaxID=167791 RepID=A0ACB9NL59_BAUVA|nr:hypothetical protein L6164_015631 [Bauhinia variegata]
MVRPSATRQSHNTEACRGAWTGEEDQKLVQAIELYGPRRWNVVAANAGLNRCGRSCRLRWLNYLRPNIKIGNITDQEEDLILRLHKLLGNRWSLIAGRLPGRTDNEIKNYWNSHLSKKIKLQNQNRVLKMESMHTQPPEIDAVKVLEDNEKATTKVEEESKTTRFIEGDDLFHCADEDPLSLEWMSKFLDLDESWFEFA